MLVSTIILMVAAVLSSIISSFFPHFSINYISIFVGLIIGLVPFLNGRILPFHTEVFMYIVAPLIYFEGQSTRINLIGKRLRQILETAVLLVIVGTVFAGFSVSLLGIPLALAFLMGALSTPTDATATESVSEGLVVPERQENILKMESLFNDASGIILVTAMALWVKNGQFNYQQTFFDFLRSADGGIIIGIMAALVMISFRQFLGRINHDAYNAQILLFVSTPFFIYFIAEELKVSGIIAVVCAGLMQNSESIRSRFITPRQFHNGLVLLRLLRELLNNTIFVILGLLVVRIIRDDLIIGNTNSQWIVIGILLYITNLLVRYLYGLFSKMGNKGSIIFALGGVHGAVTLALVYMIINNVSSAQFDMIVLAEMLVIILSMVVPSIVFRFILNHDMSRKEAGKQVQRLRQEMVKEGLKAVEKIYLPENIRESVVYDLRDQKSANSFTDFWHQWAKASRYPEFNEQEKELEQRALLWAFRAERQYLDMVSQKENRRDYLFELYNEILLAESILLDTENEY